jgi:hypothetical protein
MGVKDDKRGVKSLPDLSLKKRGWEKMYDTNLTLLYFLEILFFSSVFEEVLLIALSHQRQL